MEPLTAAPVDFSRQEVLVVEAEPGVDVVGVFIVAGQLVVSGTSLETTCETGPRGPMQLRSTSIVERTGDTSAGSRLCTEYIPCGPD